MSNVAFAVRYTIPQKYSNDEKENIGLFTIKY